MTREHIIDEAKKILPAPNDKSEHMILIKVWDADAPFLKAIDRVFDQLIDVPNTHAVRFEKCFIIKGDRPEIVRGSQKPDEGIFETVWIPQEYFDDILISAGTIPVDQAAKQSLLSEYLK